MRKLITIFTMLAILTACNRQKTATSTVSTAEDVEAKKLLQGIWTNTETEDVAFRVVGDTIYYPDSISMPAYFRIIGDSILLGSDVRYAIEKQTPHLFWFKNQTGDVVKLEKNDEVEDSTVFVQDTPKVLTYTHQVKTDSVVMFNGERYHWYIAINPTKYKVVKRTYNDNGIEVENEYFDNIMHISVFHGAQKLYSSDFRKQMYTSQVPMSFLEEAILGNMQYSHIDAKGLHFKATLCIPDGASCYIVESLISFKGEMEMNLLEY